MDIETYHREVQRTSPESDFEHRLITAALGLAGETGETVDHLKKVLLHGHQLDDDILLKEIGDVLWYLTYLCNALGISLEEVMERNVAKLRKRYPEGFASARSIHREE